MTTLSITNRMIVFFACLIMLASVSAEAAFQTGMENSCIQCHSKLDDVRLVQPFQQWQESVHAEVGNTCDGCHGGNPQDATMASMSATNNFRSAPKEGEVVAFCGKCHQELADNFENGFHGAQGEPTCINCHGSHTIHRISVDIIQPEKCTSCHEYDSPQRLKTILQDLRENFQSAKTELEQIKGFPLKTLKSNLKNVWHKLRHVRMVAHTFDIEQINTEAIEVKALLAETEKEIDKLIETSQSRKIWGTLTVGLFLLLFALTYFYNKDNGADE